MDIRPTDTVIYLKNSLWGCKLCFLTELHALKAYWGSGGIAPRIDFGTIWK